MEEKIYVTLNSASTMVRDQADRPYQNAAPLRSNTTHEQNTDLVENNVS